MKVHARFLFVLFAIAVLGVITLFSHALPKTSDIPLSRWEFQSIDTMKYSRDTSREKLTDSTFNVVIEEQIKKIAQTGATHVAIATPYDEEFVPFLRRWVEAARKNNLLVWFRGNWSGWEQWFGYPKISRDEHIARTREFILRHPDLFVDGDVFSGCPECENGGPGNPQIVGDVPGYRAFLINEYRATKAAFAQIGKRVGSNYFSMNGDVARLIMDKSTTSALDGIVTIDHYVRTPEQLIHDIQALTSSSGGRVILGEFGAPIPDIHGDMSVADQAKWIGDALSAISTVPDVIGVNYWTSVGGSTALWDENGHARQAVGVLTKYFTPNMVVGVITDELGKPITDATIVIDGRTVTTDRNGKYSLLFVGNSVPITVEAPTYKSYITTLNRDKSTFTIQLTKEYEPVWFTFFKLLRKAFKIF